jgi:hypothetical protein
MVEAGAFPGPGQLPGKLHDNEVLQDRPGGTAWLVEARGVLPDEVAGDSRVGEGQLWGTDRRQGASIWCGHGVFSHNLVKIAALAS